LDEIAQKRHKDLVIRPIIINKLYSNKDQPDTKADANITRWNKVEIDPVDKYETDSHKALLAKLAASKKDAKS
jgi:hypothetical protein